MNARVPFTQPVARPAPLRLPEDLPLDEAGLARYSDFRLEPVIDALFRHLGTWMDTPARERRTPPRVGLFGGLGQGKSSAAGVALRRLQLGQTRGQRIREAVLGPRIARFDVSFFKADDLEWRFFTAVLWRRTLRNLLLVAGAVVIVALIAGALVEMQTAWSPPACMRTGWWSCLPWGVALWAGSAAVLLPMLARVMKAAGKTGKALKPVNPATGLYVAFRDLAIQRLATVVGSLPDVVLIDDLDRARVEQQRSFLRALTRFSRRMGFAVIVCMDDAEILAAPADPESPEELLRKNLTTELRVPERSREDIALLAAACVREFAAANVLESPELARGLLSLSFVGDFARVLMLDSPRSRNSPRKVQRLLVHVAMQANQLRLTHANDLSALLRIEVLYRLVPALRQHVDELREALEINRVEGLRAILAKLGDDPRRDEETCAFFNRTRMMQPALRDGWFRLLQGFTALHVDRDIRRSVAVGRWRVGPRSVDFLRAFAEAVAREADGYPHALALAAHDDGALFTFELPGGTREDFMDVELPQSVLGGRGGFCEHCWLAWLCALRTAVPSNRHAIYRRACQWSGTLASPHREELLQLVFREALSDVEMWSQLLPSQRHWWWDEVHRRGDLSLESILCIALDDHDFADAWRVLGRPGDGRFRDGRKVLAWWHHLTPMIDDDRLQGATIADPVFGSMLWPAPDMGHSNGARSRNLLMQHLDALGALRRSHAMSRRMPNPGPLREALRRALDELLPQQFLSLLSPMAFECEAPVGERWSLDMPRRWITMIGQHPLRERLRLLVESTPGQPQIADAIAGLPIELRRALLVTAIVEDWRPGSPSRLLEPFDAGELDELRSLLADRGCPVPWI